MMHDTLYRGAVHRTRIGLVETSTKHGGYLPGLRMLICPTQERRTTFQRFWLDGRILLFFVADPEGIVVRLL